VRKGFVLWLGIAIFCFSAVSVIADDETTSVFDQAKKAGVIRCLKSLEQVSNYIIKKNKHSSHSIWAKDNVDLNGFSSFVVKEYTDGDSHVSILVVPTADKDTCFAEYNETSYWPKSCSVLREEVYKDWKYKSSLKESTVILKNDSDKVFIYLSPQNNGSACLSTRREVIFY
jgi:hypothetical protein